MNIEKAIELAKEGKKVRRYGWSSYFRYVRYIRHRDVLAMFFDPVNYTIFHPTEQDLRANDWYVED